ncbi:MAG TPA: cytochrome c [Nitrospira sp.]|nr:cytochrome c [Nitrospira sp.]
MRNVFFATVVTATVLGLLAVGARPGNAAGDPAKGKAVYDKYCVACHGVQGKGDGPAGRMLKPPAADLTSALSTKKPEAELKQVIENGKPGTAMGPWKGQLSAAEMNDLMQYVLSLRK